MMRPRRWSGTVVWSRVLVSELLTIMAHPVSASRPSDSTKWRDAANKTSSTPKAVPPTSMRRPRKRMRRAPTATPSAPSIAPTPTEDVRAPYPAAPRCRTLRANTGIMVM